MSDTDKIENRPQEKVKRKDDWRHKLGNHVTRPVASVLAKLHITPNMLTWSGLIFPFGSLYLLFTEHLIWSGVVMLVGALFDSLDGAVARYTNNITVFGGVLDSVLDRITEGLMFAGIAIYCALHGEIIAAAVTLLALVLSFTVSYVRARAEGVGIECNVGICTRAERIVLMVLSLFTGYFLIAFAIIGVLSLVTVGQRIYRVAKASK